MWCLGSDFSVWGSMTANDTTAFFLGLHYIFFNHYIPHFILTSNSGSPLSFKRRYSQEGYEKAGQEGKTLPDKNCF